jgi:hypothetical protein
VVNGAACPGIGGFSRNELEGDSVAIPRGCPTNSRPEKMAAANEV